MRSSFWWLAAPLCAAHFCACSMDFDAPFAGSTWQRDASADGLVGGAAGNAEAGLGGGGAKDAGSGGAATGGASGQGGAGGQGGTAGQGGVAGQGGDAGQGGVGGTAGVGGAGGSSGAAGAPCTPSGHDEDGDGADDVCDNCPSIPNVKQANGDGDALGDACESPMGADRYSNFSYFETFLADGMSGWNAGAFVSGNDLAVGDAANCGADCFRNTSWDIAVDAPYAVETTFQLDLTLNRWGCVLFAMETGDDQSDWWQCCIGFSQGLTPGLSIWHHLQGASSVTKVSETPGIEDAGNPPDTLRRLRVDYRQNEPIRCYFDNSLNDHSEVQATPPLWDASSFVGMRAYHATVQFNSFVVYR